MHSLSVIVTYLKLGILNVVQYRADFFFQLISLVISLGTSVFGLLIIFGQTDSVGGWSRDDLIALIAIQMLVRGLIGLVIQPSMQRLMEGIRMGTLDFMLTKPADSQVLASVAQVNIASSANIVVGLGVLIVSLVRLGSAVSIGDALLFALVLIAGTVIIYSFLLMLSTLAFWFVRLDNILVIFETMFGNAGAWPITIYPGWLRVSLTFLVPVAFAVTIPAQSLTGRLTTVTMLGSVLLAVAFTIAARWFWGFGLKHYTGASA